MVPVRPPARCHRPAARVDPARRRRVRSRWRRARVLAPLLAAAFLLALPCTSARAADPERIRVGIYDNPPKIFLDPQGRPTGFWADLTQLIAEREGWEIEWVMGTWPQGLQRLAANEIDVMVDTGFTQPRLVRFAFTTEPVHVSWSRVYAADGSGIESLPDLDGRRVGGLADSFNLDGPEGLRDLLSGFGFAATIVPFDSYRAMFAALDRNEIDAGVTNKDFGNRMEGEYDIMRTPIIFQPAALHYAFTSDATATPYLIERFDHHVNALKADATSPYYQLQARWLGWERKPETPLPRWVFWTLAGLLAAGFIVAAHVVLLERRVRARTRNLRAEIETREQTERALVESEEHLHQYQRLVDASQELCAICDENYRYILVNRAYAARSGLTEEEIVGVHMAEILGRETFETDIKPHLEPCFAGESRFFERIHQPANGEPKHYLVHAYPIDTPSGCCRHVGVIITDITERKLAEEEVSRLAYEDRLTGLRSRHGFSHALAARIEDGKWSADDTVVAMNIRGLRDVNEADGYEAGDELLVQIAGRLRECMGPDSLLGRTGADDFLILVDARAEQDVEATLEQLVGLFQRPFRLARSSVETSARFGYTRLGEQPRNPETVLREAGLALQRTRDNGIADVHAAYTDDLAAAARERIAITQELREALRNDEFELFFQPKTELASGRLTGCEALLRWRHPERGLRAPGEFIAIAEQSQLITPIGDWVLREACRQQREWQRSGLQVVPVSVNVSLVQFTHGKFTETVRDALDATGVPASSLALEITETVFEQESELLQQQLATLHQMGVQLALDDFGTGYSSLLYLQKYPFDEIKIDQGFVQHIEQGSYSAKIVNTVLGLAQAIGAEVIAEGIETESMRDALIELGCRYGQGFYFSRPLEADDFSRLLQDGTALPASRRA